MTAQPGGPARPTPAGHPIFLLEKPGDTGKAGVHARCGRGYSPFTRRLGRSRPPPGEDRFPRGQPAFAVPPPCPWPQCPPPHLQAWRSVETTATLQMPVALGGVFLCFSLHSAHCARENARPRRADTAQVRGPGDPGHARGCQTAPALGGEGCRASSLGKRRVCCGSCKSAILSGKQAGWIGRGRPLSRGTHSQPLGGLIIEVKLKQLKLVVPTGTRRVVVGSQAINHP